MKVEDEEGEKSKSKTVSGSSWKYATSFQKDLMAGAVMGGVVHTIVAPIERAKLLLQTQESNIAIVAGKHRKYKGMFDCIVRVVKEEGFISLWRGNGSSVLRYYPSVALNFSLKVERPRFLLSELMQLTITNLGRSPHHNSVLKDLELIATEKSGCNDLEPSVLPAIVVLYTITTITKL